MLNKTEVENWEFGEHQKPVLQGRWLSHGLVIKILDIKTEQHQEKGAKYS